MYLMSIRRNLHVNFVNDSDMQMFCTNKNVLQGYDCVCTYMAGSVHFPLAELLPALALLLALVLLVLVSASLVAMTTPGDTSDDVT